MLAERSFGFRFCRWAADSPVEMSDSSVQRAHDALLASMPTGASHANCPLCHSGAGAPEKAKEEDVAGDDAPKYTDSQLQTLVTDGVARETAALTEARETLESEKAALTTTVGELQSRIDILEAEKAAEVQAKEKAEADLKTLEDDIAEKAAVAERKAERAKRVEAAGMPADLITEEKTQRWAEMSEESFVTFLEGLEAAGLVKPAEGETVVTPEAARETAAFSGGKPATSTGDKSGGALAAQLVVGTGRVPAGIFAANNS